MNFLDEQMDAMMLDPTPEKQFLGNTYKWWASFLSSEGVVMSLGEQSLPICLIHGVEDGQVPVFSADLLAEGLAKTNMLTYLRLEGYGHDLSTVEVRDAACQWLGSVLLGQELVDGVLIAQAVLPLSASPEGVQVGLSDYVFSRGKDKGESHGDVHGSVKGDKDSNGNENLKGDVGMSYRTGEWDFEINAGGSLNKDRNGNVSAEAHAEARGSRGF